MPSFSEFATKYADRIKAAAHQDEIARSAGFIKKAYDLATASNLSQAFREIGEEFEGLVYEATSKPLSEEDKQKIADEIARQLGWDRPTTLRRLIKGGSVDSLIQMSTEMENLFTVVKK